MGLMSHLTRK